MGNGMLCDRGAPLFLAVPGFEGTYGSLYETTIWVLVIKVAVASYTPRRPGVHDPVGLYGHTRFKALSKDSALRYFSLSSTPYIWLYRRLR